MTISKNLSYVLFGILMLSIILGLNANLRLNKIEIPKSTNYTEENIRKMAQEETVKIINQIVAQQQQQTEQIKK